MATTLLPPQPRLKTQTRLDLPPVHRYLFPVLRTLSTLASHSRREAETIQRKVGAPASPAAVVEVFCNPVEKKLLKGLNSAIPDRCPTFERRLRGAFPACRSSRVTESLLEAARLLKVGPLQIKVQEEGDLFWLDGSLSPHPTVIFHQRLERLDHSEIRFLTYSHVFTLARGHLRLRRQNPNLELEDPFPQLQALADRFRTAAAGLTAASFAILRECSLDSQQIARLVESGLAALYKEENIPSRAFVRLHYLWGRLLQTHCPQESA